MKMNSTEFLASLKQGLSTYRPGIIGQSQPIKTAVFVPLVEINDKDLSVLFTVRATSLRRQPGEISFPGGHYEPDDGSFERTAVRETSEELGVNATNLETYGPLDVLVTWSGLMIHPFVGRIRSLDVLRLNPDEVDEVFTVSLRTVLTTDPIVYDVPVQPIPGEDFPYHLIPLGKDYRWRTSTVPQYFYIFGERVIWGLTARILHHFVSVCRDFDFIHMQKLDVGV